MSDDDAPHTTLTVQAGTRPIRVAYLLDPDAIEVDGVDAIIESALDRWGGRYRGLFPLISGQIPSSCWPVLEAHDPDIVVALQPLEDPLVQRLTRRVLPHSIQLAELEPPLGDGGRWRFREHTNGVDLFGLPQLLAQQSGFGPRLKFLNIHEREGRNPHRSFMLRNFGLFPAIVAAQASLEHVDKADINVDGVTPSALLQQLAGLGYDTLSPLSLSAMGCPPPGIPCAHDHRRDQLHIVVGTSTRDAMLTWNRALFTGGQSRHKTLWIPLPLLADDDVRASLVRWLNRTGWRQENSVFLVSYEHSSEELGPIAAKLRAQLYSFVQCIGAPREEFFFPAVEATPRRWTTFGNALGDSRTVTEHVNFADGVGTMAVARPPLIESRFNQGDYMVDVLIPHRPEAYGHTNARPVWSLPKRLSFGGSFFPNNSKARITAAGLPSACFASTTQRIELRVPTDRELFYWCLAPRQVIHGRGEPPRPTFSRFATSDAGLKLRGMLRVFGGLFQATYIFEDPFWRNTLLHMAGERHAATQDRAQRIQESLTTYLSTHALTIDAASPGLAQLADAVARALVPERIGRSRLTPQELRQRFGQVRNASLASPPADNYWNVRTSFDEVQQRTLVGLIDVGVLFLGVEVRCPQCGVQHWIKVDALAARIVCPGCGTRFLLPEEPQWCYQLNDLVGNALRTAGSLATLQALRAIGHFPFLSDPFVFMPPQDIFKDRDASEFTDVDLLCLSEGALVIGEVKSRAGGFRVHDLELLAEVARAILPDRVVLASPPGEWHPDTLVKLAELTSSLEALDVKVERLELTW